MNGDVSSDLPSLGDDFVAENQSLCKPMQKSSAPFNKKERFARRQKVFELYFIRGIPATKIADLIKVNRNTINSDIQFWWSQLGKEWDYHDVNSWVMRQLKRLESQRARLMTYLENEDSTEGKLSIERLLLDIDNRISQIFINTKYSSDQMVDKSVKLLNEWAGNQKLGKLFLRKTDLTFVADEDYDDIRKKIDESKAKVRNRGTPLV